MTQEMYRLQCMFWTFLVRPLQMNEMRDMLYMWSPPVRQIAILGAFVAHPNLTVCQSGGVLFDFNGKVIPRLHFVDGNFILKWLDLFGSETASCLSVIVCRRNRKCKVLTKVIFYLGQRNHHFVSGH